MDMLWSLLEVEPCWSNCITVWALTLLHLQFLIWVRDSLVSILRKPIKHKPIRKAFIPISPRKEFKAMGFTWGYSKWYSWSQNQISAHYQFVDEWVDPQMSNTIVPQGRSCPSHASALKADAHTKSRSKGNFSPASHVEFNVIFFFFREMGLEVAISVILQKWFKKLNHPWAQGSASSNVFKRNVMGRVLCPKCSHGAHKIIHLP